MNYRFWFIIIIFLAPKSFLFAQDDFERWLQKDRNGFKEFLSKDDKQFVDFLSKNWNEYVLAEEIETDNNPKPTELPPSPKVNNAFFDSLKNDSSEKRNIKTPFVVTNITPPQAEVIAPREKRSDVKVLQTNFYNCLLNWELTEEFIVTADAITKKEDFVKFWEEVCSLKYDIILDQLLEYKKKLVLNDWGYFLLINNISDKLLSNSKNNRDMLNWFFLVKSGYKAKAGLINNKACLFIPSVNKIYKTPFFNTDNESVKLYLVSLDNHIKKVEGELITYDNDYPGAEKIFDLNINFTPQLAEQSYNKELKFSYDNKEYNLTVGYNKSVIDFYEFYPNTNLEIYFNSSVEDNTEKTLLTSLLNIIKEKPEPIAADMLLRFVQTAFGYQTDSENFNKEKPLFKEETIYYNNSDCEDRAVLFSYLVEELLGLEVIGLDYPGHVATAVKFNMDIPGDYVVYKKDKYTICDPTYIGAYIGLAMPQIKNIKLENVIELTKK